MAYALRSTGNRIRRDFVADSHKPALQVAEDLLSKVLELPGDEPDRFYVVIGVTSQRDDTGTAFTVTMEQMRETYVPGSPLSWRQLYDTLPVHDVNAAGLRF